MAWQCGQLIGIAQEGPGLCADTEYTRRLISTCGWLSVNQLYWHQVLMTTHKIRRSKRRVNIRTRMAAELYKSASWVGLLYIGKLYRSLEGWTTISLSSRQAMHERSTVVPQSQQRLMLAQNWMLIAAYNSSALSVMFLYTPRSKEY